MLFKSLQLLHNKEKKSLLFIIINSILLSLIELVVFYLLQIIISYLVGSKDLNQFPNFFFSNLINFEYLIVSFFIIFFIRGLFFIFISYKRNLLIKNVNDNLSNDVYKNFISRDYEYFVNNKSSFLISNIVNEVDRFSSFFLDSIIYLITEFFLLIAIASFLLVIYFYQTIFFLLIIISFFIFFFTYYKKKFLELGNKKVLHEANRIDDLQKSFYVIQNIKIDNLENYFINRLSKNTVISSYCTFIFKFISEIPKPAAELVVAIIIFVILYVVYFYFGVTKVEIISMLGIFMVAMFRIIPSINKIGLAINNLRYHAYTANILHSIIFSNSKSNKFFDNCNLNFSFNFSEKIVFKNVNFKYQLSNKNQLTDINLTIKKNSSISIQGPSGSGKTTLLNLMCGLLSPTSGDIYLDNKSLSLFKKNYQRIIGYVSQKTYLSNESIIKNVIFGKDEVEYDYNLFEDAIRDSDLYELVNKLEKGKDTIIGEMGSKLSGGQQQRVGIARALYKKPQIFILDEPTSALDENSENEIIKTIKKLKNKITIIIVSHNKKLQDICDENYFIKDSKIFLNK
jgi:ABC-type bacteriocin/lantibiotic exporter with double-glycine peptidase domain